MKKTILSLVLAFTLVLAYAVPVAATEAEAVAPEAAAVTAEEPAQVEAADEVVPNTADSVDKVSDDPAVQEAYDAYRALEKALADGNLAALQDAYNKLNGAEFATDAQQEEFDAIVENKIGFSEYLVTAFSAAYVIDAADKYEAFLANKNVNTAYEFVAAVDVVTEDCELSMEAFVPGISADYEDAKANYLPAENVMNVYNAYVELKFAIEWASYDEDFVEVCKAFEAVLEDFNALTEEELDQLAVLMGLEDGEAAWNQIFADWVLANIVLEVGEAYDAYYENPNAETAAALVEVYERVFLSEGFFSEEEFEVLYAFFIDIDDVYGEAKALLPEDKAPSDEPATEGTEEPAADGTPETGDESNMLAPFAVMLAAAGVAVAALKRKRVQ